MTIRIPYEYAPKRACMLVQSGAIRTFETGRSMIDGQTVFTYEEYRESIEFRKYIRQRIFDYMKKRGIPREKVIVKYGWGLGYH